MQDSSNCAPMQWDNLQGDLLAFFFFHYVQPSLLVSCVASYYLWRNSHLVGLGSTSLPIQTLFHSLVHFFSWCVQTLEEKSAWRSKFSGFETAFCAPMSIPLQSLQIGCAVCTGNCWVGFWYHFQHSDVCEVWEAFHCSVSHSSSSGLIATF